MTSSLSMAEENAEKITTAQNTETKDSYTSATPFLNKGNVQSFTPAL